MASTGPQGVFDYIDAATSEKAVCDRIDQFLADLEEQAKRPSWPTGESARREAKLIEKLKTAAEQHQSDTDAAGKFQAALDRLAELKEE
jgi:D-Tyr-tRNAtyr deacylase